MKTKELVEKLKHYNDWRRGENEAQPSPSDIGLWIDEICQKVDDQHNRITELWVALTRLNKDKCILLEKLKRYWKEANAFMLQRDEARNAIVGWENKWKCAIEMAAQAEVERDEARKEVDRYREKLDLSPIHWEV